MNLRGVLQTSLLIIGALVAGCVKAQNYNRRWLLAGSANTNWFTAIRLAESGDFHCSGSLIGSRYVVTASHCVPDISSISAEVGYWCNAEGNCGRESEVIGVRNIFPHSQGGDFVLLELADAVNLDVEPAVPYLGDLVHPNQLRLKKGRKLTMVGAGRVGTSGGPSDFVGELEVTYVADEKCQEEFGGFSFYTNFTVCTTSKGQGSPCRGDSGAALVVPGVGTMEGRDVIMAVHFLGPLQCSNVDKDQLFGEFRMEDAADLLQSVVCEGEHPEDWCQGPPEGKTCAKNRVFDVSKRKCVKCSSKSGKAYNKSTQRCERVCPFSEDILYNEEERKCECWREDLEFVGDKCVSSDDLPALTCSEQEPNVFGGVDVGADEFPWFVAIFPSGGNEIGCSGALVSDWYVLSAAHCRRMTKPWTAVIGYRCASQNNCGFPEDPIPVRVGFLHSPGDFMILELEYAVSLRPMSYAIPNLDASYFDGFRKDDTMTLVGAGLTLETSEYVQKLPLKLVKKKECNEAAIKFVAENRGYTLDGYMCSEPLCGGSTSGTCRGDSGGALVKKGPNGEDVIVAVHSFGRRICNAERKKPDGHYRVDVASDDLHLRICQGAHPAEWCP